MISRIQALYTSLDNRFATHMKVFRYLVSGGTAATTDLLVLYFLKHTLNMWYVHAAILAFIVAFGVSFTLQKYWTFRDHSTDNISAQGTVYLIVSTINLCINTLFVYLITDFLHLHYLLSQVITAIIIAVGSFFVYQKFIFKTNK